MSINGIDGTSFTDALHQPGGVIPSQDAFEDALERLQQRDSDLDFSPFQRARYETELREHLITGWLPSDCRPPAGSRLSGPVVMLREAASTPEGVVFGEDNLGLDPGAELLGKRHAHGGADSYFLRFGDRFYTLCVESGHADARYEIFVSPPRDWPTFLSYLEDS